MPPTLTADAAVEAIARAGERGRVFLSAGPAEPLALHDAWRQKPETASGLRFAGLFIPGLNRLDYASLHPSAGMDVFMLSPDWRAGFVSGQNRHRPMHYLQAFRTLLREGAPAGVVQVSRPDDSGYASFGVSADASPAMIDRIGWKLAVINHAMPRVHDAPAIPVSAFDAVVEIDHPLATLTEASSDAAAIATHVAAWVRDGDTLQSGVGKLPSAVLSFLGGRRNLRIHSGLLTAAHLALVDKGAVRDEPGAVTAGMGAGDAAFYARMGAEKRLRLVSVAETHAHDVLAAIDRFVAINAALEIDLFGQINAELAGDAQISGVGGLVDFVRGANASSGGRALVMIQAEGRGASRVVPRLTGPVTVSRVDAPIVVTEYGAVDLGPLDIDARAEAITSLAAPAYREKLRAAWRAMRSVL
ncbi:MAG: acetyl-CoA hydrolase/transferase C-terminal domain-containing protein [Hyphomonadaceae bacterium]|nr:acetyl-CoA hydrolase/transferase C-terminal domain-containing protein [Hyphomonadaceae bacterium]